LPAVARGKKALARASGATEWRDFPWLALRVQRRGGLPFPLAEAALRPMVVEFPHCLADFIS